MSKLAKYPNKPIGDRPTVRENGSREYHLCQYNVARTVVDLSDPRLADFVAGHDLLYSISDNCPGFVWRMEAGNGQASIQPFADDRRVIVGLSVWENLENLQSFVYGDAHAEFLRKRRHWFEKSNGPSYVLWWLPAGERPTVAEGHRRLQLLAKWGPSITAFNFQSPFSPPVGLLGTLGPEGTNSEKGAREHMLRQELDGYDLRLYDTFEEVADRVLDGTLDLGIVCTAYLKFSAVYFERAPKLRISESFVVELHPMVIASRYSSPPTRQPRFACQPAILPLVGRFLTGMVVKPAASNASAAFDVVAGVADICLTTEPAAVATGLNVLVRMPPLHIPFAVFERSSNDGDLPMELTQLFSSENCDGI